MPRLHTLSLSVFTTLTLLCASCATSQEQVLTTEAAIASPELKETATADRLLDFWDESFRLFGTSSGDGSVADGLEARKLTNYTTDIVTAYPTDKRVGDFSLAYVPTRAGLPDEFGFVASLWGENWALTEDMTLALWVKPNNVAQAQAWKLTLMDASGIDAMSTIEVAPDEWNEISVALTDLEVEAGFDWSSVQSLSFSADLPEGSKVLLDGIRFFDDERLIGVTDKPLSQRRAEAARTRDIRIALAFLQQAASIQGDGSGQLSPNEAQAFPAVTAFAKMMMDEDLETANAILIRQLEDSSVNDVWNLARTPLFARFYFMFSNRNGRYPGRMSEEAEALLLETLWDRTAAKNDIALTRQSTWWMEGSENHDLNMKASNLVVSRIFMNEPAYKDRILPNYGFAGAYHYGHAGYYGPGIDFATRKGGGRAALSDGVEYTATDHYEAWVEYFKRYFRERGERGFFLEYASPGYSKHSMGFVDLVHEFAGDPELEDLVSKFVTVFWADWAQTSIMGIRGGPKTRHHRSVGGTRDKQTADLISFHLGGPGNAGTWWYWNMIGDFELPDVIWKMALDRESMGSFTYTSRGIGEEENRWPRPLGTERAMIVDTESRLLKRTLVTPHYTLGTQMDHPAAVHSHLSVTGRWHGMTTAESRDARLVAVGLPKTATDTVGRRSAEFDTEIMMQTVQTGRTLILQQFRRWYAAHPTWFPSDGSRYDKEIGLWFGNDWDQRIEQNGWVFVRKGQAVAATRPVTWDEAFEREKNTGGEGNQRFFNKPYDDPKVKLLEPAYTWNETGTIMKLVDRYAVIIVETANLDDYGSLNEFMADVLDNALELHKTVVPGFHVMVYTGSGLDAEEIVFNAAAPDVPTIGGEPVNYADDHLFDSPFMQSEYKSGLVELNHSGHELVLDFQQ
ncbi:MAG: hypothetical protein AAFZ91_12880 [Pseudomonadota bacterium]